MESNIYLSFRLNFLENHTEIEKNKNLALQKLKIALKTYNKLFLAGIPVVGTYAVDNYGFLEQNLMLNGKELIGEINKRINEFDDEVMAVSYNESLLSLCSESEFNYLLKQTYFNDNKSGLNDVFSKVSQIFCPPNAAFTPSLIEKFKRAGVLALTMKNSTFVGAEDKFNKTNPFYIKSDLSNEKMPIICTINERDIFNYVSLKSYIKTLRKEQQKQSQPRDILIVLDVDFFVLASIDFDESNYEDDESIKKNWLFKSAKSVSKLPYVKFCSPSNYLNTHQVGDITICNSDIASDEVVGEMFKSLRVRNLYKNIERARTYDLVAESRLTSCENIAEITALIKQSVSIRSSLISLNAINSETALTASIIKSENALKLSKTALNLAYNKEQGSLPFVLTNPYTELDGVCGLIYYNNSNQPLINGIKANALSIDAKDYAIIGSDLSENFNLSYDEGIVLDVPVVQGKEISNITTKLTLNKNGITLKYKNQQIFYNSFVPKLVYKSKTYVGKITGSTIKTGDSSQVLSINGEIVINKSLQAYFSYLFILTASLPYVYFSGKIKFPKEISADILPENTAKESNYKAVMPFEINCNFFGTEDKPIKIIKNNFFGDQTICQVEVPKNTKKMQKSTFSPITCGYIGATNSNYGLLVSQNLNNDFSPSFCSFESSTTAFETRLKMNPFGSYEYKAEDSVKDFLKFFVPKYCKKINTSLNDLTEIKANMMLAPFFGVEPSDEVKKAAFLNSYQPIEIAGVLKEDIE